MEESAINYPVLFKEYFEQKDYCFHAEISDDAYHATIWCSLDNRSAPPISWNMRVTRSGSAKIWAYLADGIRSPARLCKTLNAMNDELCFAKLSVDGDGDLSADYDFILCGNERECLENAETLLMLLNSIVEDCYPALMEAIWGEDLREEESSAEIPNDLARDSESEFFPSAGDPEDMDFSDIFAVL